MYTYFYVCSRCSVHVYVVSISVIHTCFWRQDLYVNVMGVYVWYILACGRQCRTLDYFFPLLLSSLLCYGSICHSAWSDISAGLVGSTCSTPTHSQSGDYMLMHSCLGLHAHAAMPSFLYDCCPYPYIGNTFTRWDVSIPPYIHTVFSAQERANKFPHSYPEAFWYRNRSLGDWKP